MLNHLDPSVQRILTLFEIVVAKLASINLLNWFDFLNNLVNFFVPDGLFEDFVHVVLIGFFYVAVLEN